MLFRSQSTNQRCNAGSFIAGFSVSTHNLNFDYTKLPEIIQETMNPGMKVKHIKYTNISLNAGYAYNWVFARNCLACLSFNPAVAYKTSRIEKTEEREADDWYKNFNIDFILRGQAMDRMKDGALYNLSAEERTRLDAAVFDLVNGCCLLLLPWVNSVMRMVSRCSA